MSAAVPEGAATSWSEIDLEAPLAPMLRLLVRFIDVPIHVLTNDPDVMTSLRQYLRPYVTTEDLVPTTVVTLIQGRARLRGTLTDVARASGRVKEAVREVEGGRWILRRGSGVLMGLWRGRAVAIGDLRTHLKEAINLIDACCAKTGLGRGYVLLHAAGASRGGRAVALAGVPGAGKSTAALHLVEAGFRFLSNDRVLARPVPEGVDARGFPKRPQVHPGTLLTHPRLGGLLDPEERRSLGALSHRELWQHARGRSRPVDLDALYGPGTVCLQARLELVVLLSWTLDGQGFAVRRLDVQSTLAQWPIFYKDLGVFDVDRAPAATPTAEDLAPYRQLLGRLTVVEVSGQPDFAALVDAVRSICSE